MHKCTKCGSEYETEELMNMKGCAKCGSTLFVFSKTKKFDKFELDEDKINEIERKIKNNPNEILADVKVIDEGIFSINLNTLSKNKPIVVEGEEGVYFIKFK
jgi:predicted  nucleic acid-binding Zn-ribbon protein